MKKIFTFLLLLGAMYNGSAQGFDSLSYVVTDGRILDITSDGTNLYAAMGEGGIYKSTDDGATWTALGKLPDAGFGDEGGSAVFVASNGDIIVGGNTYYSGNAFAGAAFRSTNGGTSWTAEPITGFKGYETVDNIMELTGGKLLLKTSLGSFFQSDLTTSTWTKVAGPGGVVYGAEGKGDLVLAMNNPAGGTAGLWASMDAGTTWERYGSNNTGLKQGTVTVAPIIFTKDYKFAGLGGTNGEEGIYKAGINDTAWVKSKTGITKSSIYPTSMVSDDKKVWMIFEGVAQCYLTVSSDMGDNWAGETGMQPSNSRGTYCMKKLVHHKTHIYAFANTAIYRLKDVAENKTGGGTNPGGSNSALELDNDAAVLVYPNPSEGTITVNNASAVYQVYNLIGELVYNGSNSTLSLNAGVYVVNMNGVAVKVVVK